MAKTILNSFQKQTLHIFGRSFLQDKFYLSGGTALAEFQHGFGLYTFFLAEAKKLDKKIFQISST